MAYRIGLFLLLCMCSLPGRAQLPPVKHPKLPAEELKQDLHLLKDILEANHPSLYWYTSREELDSLFSVTLSGIKDSMSELQFKNRVSAYVSRIRCGHTSVQSSRAYIKVAAKDKFPLFPLAIKVWADSMVVLANYNSKDSTLRRGTKLLSLNGRNAQSFIDTFSAHISGDGYGKQFASQLVSSNFGNYYKNILGLDSLYQVAYINAAGERADTILKNLMPADFNLEKKVAATPIKPPSKRQIRKSQLADRRSLQIDTATKTAFIRLSSFSGAGTGQFIRKSFRTINQASVNNLVIDLRTNGGGSVKNSTLLTRYLSDHAFRIADTVARPTHTIRYKKYIQQAWAYQLLFLFSNSKREDGKYHFRRFEKKVWQPLEKNHFGGDVFLVQGGYSFSAATLVLGELKGQKNVRLLGEETGGAYYGNSAMMIPSITLPNSKLRISLPLYRLVINNSRPKGVGVVPDIPVPPSSEAIKRGVDPKIDRIRLLISGSK
jgi:hypothetical protein